MELSYCVVNTNGRDYLSTCLDAIDRTHPAGVEHEVLVLDNASDDGSVELIQERYPDVRLIACERRAGLADNNTRLLREANGRLCLLLNEDSELLDGATTALLEALQADPEAAVAGAQLVYPSGKRIGCAWRLPGAVTAIAEALFLDRWVISQVSRTTREVGAVQSAAMLVRHDAAQAVGYFDSDFFLYYEETELQTRMRKAGWRILHVPAARAIHHQQFSTQSPSSRKVVEFHRMRDLYMRKHRSKATVAMSRVLGAWKYTVHAIVATILPGRDPTWYWEHVRQSLRPERGEGLREQAEAYNARLAATPAADQAARS